MTSQHNRTLHGGWLFKPVQVAVGSSPRSEVEAGRLQAQQTLLPSFSCVLAPASRLCPWENSCAYRQLAGAASSVASWFVPLPTEVGMASHF